MSSDDDDAAFLSLTPIQDLDLVQAAKDIKELTKKPQITLDEINSKKAKARAARYKEKQQQSGIVYIGRVPPSLGPGAVREMLAQFGTILRVYFKPESRQSLGHRRAQHRATARRYDCGWIEFSDKRHAKKCAVVLNGTAMKSTTNSRQVREDLWMLQYLSKVKWDDLRQEHQHFDEIHNVKTAKAMEEGRSETSEFIRNYHESKQFEAQQQAREVRRLKSERNRANAEVDGGEGGAKVASTQPQMATKRTASQMGFEQNAPAKPPKPSGAGDGKGGDKPKVMRKLL